MNKYTRKTRIVVAIAAMALGIGLTIAYATLPPTNVPPDSVPLGTLAGKTSVNVLSVDAFTRTINQGHGPNSVLQHIHFPPNFSTGWHTHPGPNLVLIMSGTSTLIDEHCNETTYGPGQGFATGLNVHEAIAGPEGVDAYLFFLLPEDADVLRTDANPPVCLDK
jgi:quercetin dioxygenase-like cupin family protein